MRHILTILQPRAIPSVLPSLQSLPIDKIWVRYLRENAVMARWSEVLNLAAPYDTLTLISDDAIARPHHLAMVLSLLEANHPVVTGWSNLAQDSIYANLSKTPVGPHPGADAYTFPTMEEVFTHPEPTYPTYLAGFSLTGMHINLWHRFRFKCIPSGEGSNSDYLLSRALNEASIPIIAARDAFIFHTKQNWLTSDHRPGRQNLAGLEPPSITLETWKEPS